jgi:peptidoglycan/xylan/chitin deacetylase (PgdA/CDA1 family)
MSWLKTTLTGLLLAVPLTAQPAIAMDCDQNYKALGTSRTIEIDTSGGPLFGDQYPLAPQQDLLREGEVVLTFDDGPFGERTMSIADALAAECAKATFFMVGRMAIAYPEVVREIAARGHSIGGHTWSHAWLSHKGTESAIAEAEKGLSAVAAVDPLRPIAPFFRFPYLADPKSVIEHFKTRNIAVLGIHVDSRDTRGYRADRIVSWTIEELKRQGKGIVLLHDIKEQTALAVPDLLAALKQNGFKVVHVVPKLPLETLEEQDLAIASLIKSRYPRLALDIGLVAPPSTPPVPARRSSAVALSSDQETGTIEPVATTEIKPEVESAPRATKHRRAHKHPPITEGANALGASTIEPPLRSRR